jgi:shikimate kinase/3-dehydroquinate synthase
MGSGKSTVGRRAAELAGVAFEDLDRTIEQRAGMSIAELFRREGEASFRRREGTELARVLDEGGAKVVALGGGALVDRETRLDALERATVVTLHAPLSVLLSRARDDGARPLLAGPDRVAQARHLLEIRAAGYAESHARLDTSVLDADAAARAALELWRREPIAVALGERSYAVEVGSDFAPERILALLGAPTSTLIVSDRNVAALHLEPLARRLGAPVAHLLEPGERHKTVAALEGTWRALADAALDRGGTVVALGGGVVSDIAGLAAATWQRGVRWIALPTTLLAMVDASVGGKTAIDLGPAKNAVGAFWQPSAVLCDCGYLATEPERGHRSALAEVVKTALIGDAALLDLCEREAVALSRRDPELLRQIIGRSVAVKARIVSRDERESGLRALLNFGHTIGHALEACTGYEHYAHGEAVALGSVAALALGVELGETPPALLERVTRLLGALGLPVDLARAPLSDAVELLDKDKKRRGTYIHFVLAKDAGKPVSIPLELAQLRRIARSLGS